MPHECIVDLLPSIVFLYNGFQIFFVIIAKFWSLRFFYIESAIVHLDFEHLFYDQQPLFMLIHTRPAWL